MPDNLNPLLRNTIFFGHVHHWHEVESTNLLAAQAVSANRNSVDHPEGEVFLAEEQRAGKGRGSHSWYSERGAGIYCSIVVRPHIAPADALWLSLIAGVAAQDAVREVTGLSADIRWPNDLLIHEKKFCGILAELSTEANRVNHAVVGIGINVNHGAFPEELRNLATSLRLASGREWARVELTAALLKSFDREYRGLLRAVHNPIKIPSIQFGPILRKVEARCSYAHGRLVHVNEEGGYSGTTDGLDHRGFLRVRTSQGLRIVISGSVRPLRGRLDAAGC